MIRILYSITLVGIAAFGAQGFTSSRADEKCEAAFGMLADVHYADRDATINRYYRESLARVQECVGLFNSADLDFAIELGDLIDKSETRAMELDCLRQIEREYARFRGERHYVLGNHDLASFSKEQFMADCGAEKIYYSFDVGNIHFVILDGCYNEDGTDYNTGNFHWMEAYIPRVEQEWLKDDLEATGKKTIVFVHQRLDDEHDAHGVGNASEVREILERSEKVLAVFQGHDHRGAYSNINNIHYLTLPSVVDGPGFENNSYAVVRIMGDYSIKVKGYGKMKDREFHI